MGQTTFLTGNAGTVKKWLVEPYREMQKQNPFAGLEGKGAENLVTINDDFKGEQGDNVTFTLIPRITSAGVTGDSGLEGNETGLTTYTDSLSLDQYRNAVRDAGRLSSRRPAYSVKEQNRSALTVWGSEKIISLKTGELQTSPTSVYSIKNGVVSRDTTIAAAKTGLAATDLCTPALLSYLTRDAKTGRNRVFPPIKSISYGGFNGHVAFVHPNVATDLRNDSTWQQAYREAMERSKDNPLFKGSISANIVGYWQGVMVVEHENMNLYTDGGTNGDVVYSQGVLCGAQALLWAWGMMEEMVEETFDYKNQTGLAWAIIAGVAKPTFNSHDFGSLGFITAYKNI